ncbi:MAG: hypothetical protein PHD82_08045 [Candidatus Riflebacteria bacterium]|nr:hypothetical protein [Candidatus Riflebacteria bacterium]
MHKYFLMVFVFFIAAISARAVEMPAGILFVGVVNETSDIYLWLPTNAGGQTVPLTRTPQKEGNACWWARNGLVLASREQTDGNYGLVALDEKLKTIWELNDPFGSLGWPVPSPYDNRILCVRALSNGFVQTGIVNYPDGGFEPFEFEGLAGGQLAWLGPDKVMLSRVTADGFVITHRELSTGSETVIVSGGQNWQSHINEATGKMFFVRRVGQTGSIFELFQNADQSWEYENLTNGRVYDWQPGTSSDGKTLIYRSLRAGRFETVLRDLASGQEKQLDMPGFAQIYFPVILERDACEKLLQSSQTL